VRHQPYFAGGAPMAAVLALTSGLLMCARRERAHRLLAVIAWSGAAYAAFGILSLTMDPTKVLWRDKQVPEAILVSTFINPNTAASYFGSCSVIWLLFLSEAVRHRARYRDPRAMALLAMLTTMMSRDIVIRFCMLLLCFCALLMTRSRAGVVLSLAVLALASTAYWYRYLEKRGNLLFVALAAGALALAVLYALGGGVIAKFDELGTVDRGRVETYRATWHMIVEHPWFGTGLGTFPWAFPAYRSDTLSIWGVWDRAHSTPLELAAELGLPLAVLIGAAWLAAFAVLARGIMIRQRDRIVPIAAFCVAALANLHSAIDFPLQIPGYAIVVFALLGAGLAQSFPSNPTAPRQGSLG
jgi:O-antigen ligase